MPKSSNKQIEEDEKKVIKLLLEDSRQSPNEIAKKLGFSRQKAWKIIKQLEKENKIWGYTAIIGEENNDRTIYFALTKNKIPIFDYIDTIIKRAREKCIGELDIQVTGTFYLNGSYDWLTIFTAENIKEAKIFCSYLQKHYGDYIERVELLESVFTLIKCGKINPELEKMKNFAID